nr:hypothetical protein [Candidatus Sigynarchaeum springense]MDO8116511.1 hypothetical protein [Candidatus Sigynarchaeota archaeon]
MKEFQSDAKALRGQIERLEKANRGVYEFNWYHPIKLPIIAGSSRYVASFFDRSRDVWIQIAPVIQSPVTDDFDPRLVDRLPEEPDTFLVVGSFHVVLEKRTTGWLVSVRSVL